MKGRRLIFHYSILAQEKNMEGGGTRLRLITSKAKDKEGEGVEPLCSLGKLSLTEFQRLRS